MAARTDSYPLKTLADGELEPVPPESSLLSKDSRRLPGWPTAPKAVRKSITSRLSDWLVDAVLLVIAVLFLVFGLVVLHYDQAETAVHPRITRVLVEGAQFAPSVFPILFAAVIARAAHTILIRRLEQGASVGMLDLLAGSTSLTSSVTSQLQLRMVTVLGPILLIIWAFSPLGGQASLRMLSLGVREQQLAYPFNYTVYGVLSPSSVKDGTTDPWGNVKVPSIEEYENVTTADGDGWFLADKSRNVYTSLAGLPIAGMQSGNSSYSLQLEANYFNVDCASPIAGESFAGVTRMNSTDMYDHTRYDTPPDQLQPQTISFLGLIGGALCTVTTTYMELNVSCNGTQTSGSALSSPGSACAAYKLRRSRLNHPPPALTFLDDASGEAWGQMAQIADLLTGQQGSNFYGAFNYYLINPYRPLTALDPDAQNLTAKQVSQRFEQMMNTWWNVLGAPFAISTATPMTDVAANVTNTTGTQTTRAEIIVGNHGWIAVLCVASAILIIASLVRPVLRQFLTRGPDVLLKFSSLATRNNAYITLPGGGSSLQASDRARLLKGLKVRFGDVEPDNEVGRLVIGEVDTPDAMRIGPIRKGRLYE